MATNVSVQKDIANKKIIVVREFDAPVEQVWNAWTKSELLDEWWAPKPWKARTKSFEFREGGHWLYAMEGPNGEVHWSGVDFKKISANKYFMAEDYFCDENGKRSDMMGSSEWTITFEPIGNGTRVTVEIVFGSEADMNKLLEMGFEQGFSMALGNLDEELKNH